MATVHTSQVSFFNDPPYETWYAECAARFAAADLATKRKMLFRAIMFAGHSANNKVATCERDYSAWVVSNYDANYLPSFCPTRWQRLYDSAASYIAEHCTIDWFTQDKWTLVYDLSRNIVGLGAVKASFALALVGYDIACLDTHALQNVGGYSIADANYIYGLTNPKTRKDAIETYRAYHDALFPENARAAQWAFFREEPTFRATGHRTYFQSQGVHC